MSNFAERASAGRSARIVGWVVACAVAIALGGCQSLFKKKPSPPPGVEAAPTDPARPFWSDPGAPGKGSPPTANIPSTGGGNVSIGHDPELTGIIAGRVIGSNGVAFVQVSFTEAAGKPPIDVETSSQGYFTVRGLAPGRNYKLVARMKSDGRVLTGEAFARPPDARVLIPLTDDYIGGPHSPPPVSAPVSSPPGELGSPRPNSDFYPPANAENIAAGEDFARQPRANIPVPGLPDTGVSPIPAVPRASGPVPDCLVANGRVLTLRLADPDGSVWDFSQRTGRLVLIDLWGTWCTPCLKAIPKLTQLQQQYRPAGLEVIGIACENGSADANAKAVRAVRQRIPSINYRLLMAGEQGRDPVRAQFRPAGYPSLVLLDGDGTVLWKGVGTDSFSELQTILRTRLGAP